MSSLMPEPAEASQATVIAQLEERNRLLRQQVETTDALRTEISNLRQELAQRPSRDEVFTRRTLSLVAALVIPAMLLLIWLAIWLHEQYRDSCEIPAPGGGIIQADAPAWCGLLFPGDGHAGPED